MADYKRMVSYMYQYDNGVKKKNVGYARIEAKNGDCKITLHMQLPGLLDSIFPTYMIQRKAGDMELIYIGDAVLKNQVMDSKLSANEANIMNSGYGLSDMGGMLLFLNESVFYATEWDDKPVLSEEVMGALKPKRKEERRDIESPEILQEAGEGTPAAAEVLNTIDEELDFSVPFYQLPRGWKTSEFSHPKEGRSPVNPWEIVERERRRQEEQELKALMPGEMAEEGQEPFYVEDTIPETPQEAGREAADRTMEEENNGTVQPVTPRDEAAEYEPINRTRDNMEQPDAEYSPQPGYIPGGSESQSEQGQSGWRTEPINELREERTNADRREEGERPENPVAEKIFESYPRIYPFEDNEITLCVKIEPKDIGYLPVEAWVLSNNSFLLHGYYCYNHLIFAKIKDRNGCRYILGVPGIYHNRERFMARMFGFECFKSIRKRELRQGDFGYWYIPITMQS